MDDRSRNVTLKVAGSVFKMSAGSAEEEHYLRCAAEEVDRLYKMYESLFPNEPVEEKMTLIAVDFASKMLREADANRQTEASLDAVSNDLKAYLNRIDNNR